MRYTEEVQGETPHGGPEAAMQMKRTAATQEALDWMEGLIQRMQALADQNDRQLAKVEAELAAIRARKA